MIIKQKNQKFKLSTGIRNNLDKYQESKIFREIVQNAEDSGANEVIIKLDQVSYGTDKLFFNKDHQCFNNLKDLQGPSIIIYNNGVFKDSDWEGIEYIGEGSKKKDMLSIGNFGLGFNSTYHITDCPQIVSGRRLWFLDPLNLIGEGIECEDFTQVNYTDYEDQFKPFEQFGCDMKSYFAGTIIRLPLRLVGNELKATPITINGCTEILQEFYKEMSEIPLFLKVISSITLCINSNFYYKVQVMNHNQIKDQRKKVGEYLKSIVNNQMKDKTNNYEFNDIISKKNQDNFKSTYQLNMETTLHQDGITKSKNISFIVSQGIYVSDQLNKLVVDSEIKLVSYGGVAIPINNDSDDNIQVYDQAFQGKPFCFLPIGNQLISSKSHVFGYYILSDARSEVQYSCQSSRENTQEYKINKWNQFISKQVVPFFYTEALKYMTRFNIDLASYFPYHCLDSKTGNSTFERDFSSSTMDLIMHEQLFLNHFQNSTQRYNNYESSIIIKDNTPQFIVDQLNKSNTPNILLQDSFIKYLQIHYDTRLLISPSVLCKILSNSPLDQYSKEILNYLCSDDKVISSGSLHGIKLLPINQNDGQLNNLGTFNNSSFLQPSFIIVSKEVYSLLVKMQVELDYILDISQMGDNFIEKFESIKKHYINIKSIDISTFLNKVNTESSSLYHNEIWTTIESLYSFHLNNSYINDQISKLPIFKYFNNPSSSSSSLSTVSFTSYSNPKVFSSLFFNSLSTEVRTILNRLKFIIVECEGAANRFISSYDSRENSTNKLLQAVYNIGPLDSVLSTNEISSLRYYIFNLLNQSYHSFDKWGIVNTEFFFSIPMHECIGRSDKQFTSISSESTCVKFTNIRNYEIIGKELILLDSNIYDSISIYQNIRVYKKDVDVYLNYLLPSLSRFDTQNSISIINDFVYKQLRSEDVNQLKLFNWILTSENKLINLDKLYHLNNLEIEIFKIINPSYVIHEELLDVSYQLFKRKFIRSILPSEVIDLTTKYLQNKHSQEVYQLLLKYFDQFETSELDKFNKVKFIPSSLVNTYQGFGPTSPTLSISEVTIIEHKDIKFSVKHPVKFDKDSSIYKYIKDDTQAVFDHWYKLLKERNSIQYSTSLNLSEIFESIYKAVSKYNIINKITHQQRQVLDSIEKTKVLWYKDQFVDINRLYIEGDYALHPFYYKINLDYYKIFESFQLVKKKLQLEDYYSIISDIQNKNEVTKDLIHMYCHCLKLISTNNLNQAIKRENIKLLPTVDNQLIQFNNVVFSEVSIPSSDGYHQLHKEIDLDTVENLNILKLSQVMQENHALSFGQSEDLVTRLQNLLKDYRVEGFFNEMIQNASDAKASEFKIFIDNNTYTANTNKRDVPDIENYLSSSLIIYNNSTFSDRDIENVKRIGSSYKKKEESAIGYNGLGINSAYNFSNTISILSGKYLMILDPFITHIPVSIRKATGCKYEIKKHFNQYKDYFQPFLRYKKLLNLDFNNDQFNGTIIRLPLKKNYKKEKNIGPSHYDNLSILKLFKELKKNKLHNCMLFTNINQIEIGQLSGDNYELLYKTTKNTPKALEARSFNNMLDTIPMDAYEDSYTILNKNHQKKKEKRFIVGSSKVFDSKEKYLEHLPAENKIKRFLTLYTEEKRKPYGSIAFEISETNGSYVDGQKSKSFCYLPFKDLDLPFNVNGDFNMTTSRDIYESNKALHIELGNDILERKADVNVQQLESFLIYWNTILIEELITPIFIKTLLVYKDNYILNIQQQPDANNYMELVPNYYNLFPNNSDHNNSIFQKLVNKFYQLSKFVKFNYMLPHPSYYSNNNVVQFFLVYDSTKINHQPSVLKLFSHYGNVYVIPLRLIAQQLEPNELVIRPELLSKLINGRSLPQDIISNNEYLFQILVYLGVGLSNNCQLLKLKNGSVDFIGSVEKILYNEQYYNLIKNNNKINKDELFIDIKYSEMILSNKDLNTSISTFNILQLGPLDFFFKVIYPNYDSFSSDETISNLEFLKSCFFSGSDSFTMSVSGDRYQKLKESKLIPSNYKNVGGAVQLYPITKLYSFEFKPMFDLAYPLDCFNTREWNIFFQHFGIKNHLDSTNIADEFKRLSNEYYLLKDEEIESKREELFTRSRYLWDNANKMKCESRESYKELFNTVSELNIIPTKPSTLFGSKSMEPILGRISSCYDSHNESLLYTVKYKSDISIHYPHDYIQFTNEDVYENVVNIFNNHNQWPKRNNYHNYKIFELLRTNLQYLEDQLRNRNPIRNYHKFKIHSLPVQDSTLSITFEHIIFESLNVKPFFTSLPPFYASYQHLFNLLGVSTINNQQVIINRLNQFLHHQLDTNGLRSFKNIYDCLLSILNQNNDTSIPILTDINFLKPLSNVFYIDSMNIYDRININGRLWVVNKMYHNDLNTWSIQKLSNLVKESINFERSIFKTNQSLEFDIFTLEFLKDVELIKLVSSNSDSIGSSNGDGSGSNIKNRILTIEIKYGIIYVKTLLKRDNSDISNGMKTNYYYDANSGKGGGTLYLDDSTDLYSTLEQVLGFNSNSLKNIFNRISANRNETKDKTKIQELETILNNYNINNGSGNNSNNSKVFYNIAQEKNRIATMLYGGGKNDDVFKYCNKSISYSIKSILEYQGISYSSRFGINKLKSLSINLQDFDDLSEFQINLNLFKTSLCQHSNQDNAYEILDLSNQYLRRAKSLIH